MINRDRRVEVPCTIEIEQTPESFHAHAIPEDVEIGPGDTVLVQGAPTSIPHGACFTLNTRATVIRAGWVERVWTQWRGLLELTELYEVGFAPKEQHP